MTQTEPKVKRFKSPYTGEEFFLVVWARKCGVFVDSHPRVGWYVAALSTLNVVLEFLNLLH